MENEIAAGLELLGAVSAFLFVLRTALAGVADGLGMLAVRLHAADMRDGRVDWQWTRSLAVVADVLGGLADALDESLDALPVRGLRRRG